MGNIWYKDKKSESMTEIVENFRRNPNPINRKKMFDLIPEKLAFGLEEQIFKYEKANTAYTMELGIVRIKEYLRDSMQYK